MNHLAFLLFILMTNLIKYHSLLNSLTRHTYRKKKEENFSYFKFTIFTRNIHPSHIRMASINGTIIIAVQI